MASARLSSGRSAPRTIFEFASDARIERHVQPCPTRTHASTHTRRVPREPRIAADALAVSAAVESRRGSGAARHRAAGPDAVSARRSRRHVRPLRTPIKPHHIHESISCRAIGRYPEYPPGCSFARRQALVAAAIIAERRADWAAGSGEGYAGGASGPVAWRAHDLERRHAAPSGAVR